MVRGMASTGERKYSNQKRRTPEKKKERKKERFGFDLKRCSLGNSSITVIVNTGIQMGTRVIQTFFPEHIITLCFMLLVLLITCSSALALPTMKQLLKKQYELKREQITCREGSSDHESTDSAVTKLRNDYVLCRSSISMIAASDLFCILEACPLIQAFIRTLKPGLVTVCSDGTQSSSSSSSSSSDYRTVLVGNHGDSSGTKSKDDHGNINASREYINGEIPTEKSRLQRLVEWKDRLLVGFKESIRIERY
ncbi:hypothetical protein ACLOJK_033691 [Asimina triloba]